MKILNTPFIWKTSLIICMLLFCRLGKARRDPLIFSLEKFQFHSRHSDSRLHRINLRFSMKINLQIAGFSVTFRPFVPPDCVFISFTRRFPQGLQTADPSEIVRNRLSRPPSSSFCQNICLSFREPLEKWPRKDVFLRGDLRECVAEWIGRQEGLLWNELCLKHTDVTF